MPQWIVVLQQLQLENVVVWFYGEVGWPPVHDPALRILRNLKGSFQNP
jgi:hypothetical protein